MDELTPKWSLPSSASRVFWRATLNEDYQPTPLYAWFAIGQAGVGRMLHQVRSLFDARSGPLGDVVMGVGLVLVVDPEMDLSLLGEEVLVDGVLYGIEVRRAEPGV